MKPYKDIYDKDILVDENGFQVMMEWEKPYMQKLIDNLKPTGDVLEIGFGLGYSATKIASYPIKSYTVIEKDPSIIENIKKWGEDKLFPIYVIEGMWQEQLNSLSTYDSIMFDDSPCVEYPDEQNIRFNDFFYRIMLNHANRGARLTWYLDSPGFFFVPPYVSYAISSEKMFIDPTAEYVTESGDEMYFPLVTFEKGSNELISRTFLSKNIKIVGLEGFESSTNNYSKSFFQDVAFAIPTIYFK